nr:MAG TPA: hypothetical protein [Microviridae sp.]
MHKLSPINESKTIQKNVPRLHDLIISVSL